MVDRGKITDGLRRCESGNECTGCPYAPSDWVYCTGKLAHDVLELLAAKEPIKKSDMYFCADCKTALSRTHNYCHKCGRAVKWK